jgi:hypothetical protein
MVACSLQPPHAADPAIAMIGRQHMPRLQAISSDYAPIAAIV